MAETLETLVTGQFGPRAQAYVESAVHASGADLDWIEAHLRGCGGGAFLDLGCGGGHVGYRAAPWVRSVTACDLSEEMLRVVRATAAGRGIANLEAVQAPAESLPFAEGRFDLAATRYSAHHWGDLEQGLREAARVLRPGGLFLVVDVAAPAHPLLDTHLQAVELLRDPSHVRDRSAAEWTAALGGAGFAIEELRGARARMDFASWTERIGTPAAAIAAIRHLQGHAPAEVARHFALEADGSFELDTLWIAARRR